MTNVEGMDFTRYRAPVDLYVGLRVKRTFRPSFEPIDSLEALGLVAPEGSVRVGVVRVPANMMERSRGEFGTSLLDHQQDRTWLVAEYRGGRHAALGQYVPKIGYTRAPPSADLERHLDAR